MNRRLFLRRIGVVGGLGLLVASPWIAHTSTGARGKRDEPLELRFPAFGYRGVTLYGHSSVRYALDIGVHDQSTKACLEEAEDAVLLTVDTWLLDGGSERLDPHQSYHDEDPQLLSLVAEYCPAPGSSDDDSTDGYAWVSLEYSITEHENDGDEGVEPAPNESIWMGGCACATPTGRRRTR